MFTGLVEQVGELRRVEPRGGAVRLSIAAPFVGELQQGESVAVDGICLTVVATTGGCFEVDVIPETLRRTTLGEAAAGRRLNLERALRAGDRLGGHFVQGHIDATAPVAGVRHDGEDYRLAVTLTPELAPYVAYKGSIALHGVSLTVAEVGAERFTVALIPETLEKTTLGALRAGDGVHVEVDVVARYLERILETRGERTPGE